MPRNVSDDYTRLDFGLVGGAGYRLKSGPVANSVGVAYYYGLVDVDKSDLKLTNATLYVYMRIPIGAGGKYDKEK